MKYDVYGMGNALVDKEFEVSDAFLAEQSIEKGLMTLIDEDKHHELLNGLQASFGLKKRAGGGSAANTVVSVSQFGGKTFYACKVANDEFGQFYQHDLQAAGVDTGLDRLNADGVTGKCMVMVTPDAERTMNTFLGITADFSAAEVHMDELRESAYLYVEGYLVTSDVSRNAVLEARKVAREAGVKMAYTFSDPSMVTYFKAGVDEVIGDGVDILFCNEEEALIYTGADSIEAAVEQLITKTDKLVVTLGREGALVANSDGSQIRVPTQTVEAVDTNGAGDMFAGAFLYGVTQGMSDEQAATLANRAAGQIVTVFGARLDREVQQQVLAEVVAA
ncbi:MAG: adenosine kinase [Thiolinea sp.]